MTAYSLPALIALAFKAALFAYAIRSPIRSGTSRLFLLLLGVLGAHNLTEILAFAYFPRHGPDSTMAGIGYAYLITFVIAAAVLLHLTLHLIADLRGEPIGGTWTIYVPPVLLSALMLGTDQVVAGFTPFLGNVIRLPGPWYFLFEIYLALYLVLALGNILAANLRPDLSPMSRIRMRLWLVGLSPLVLLTVYLLASRHLPLPQISSTFHLPIAQNLFLVIVAYATYQYRLFDIEFYVPGSPARRRKTAFYRRIQDTIAEISELPCADTILHRVFKVLSCPVALIGQRRPILVHAGPGSLELAQFPAEAAAHIDAITLAREIETTQPDLHRLMRQFGVAAIVPFYPRSSTAASFLLLGNQFDHYISTPLDFKRVEHLFSALAEASLDSMTSLRTELADSERARQELTRRMLNIKAELINTRQENDTLRRSIVRLASGTQRREPNGGSPKRRKAADIIELVPHTGPGFSKPLGQQIDDYERSLLTRSMARANGNHATAAELLGLTESGLRDKLQWYGVQGDTGRGCSTSGESVHYEHEGQDRNPSDS